MTILECQILQFLFRCNNNFIFFDHFFLCSTLNILIRILKEMLSCFLIDPNNNTDSEVKIPKLVFAYNAAEHASTNQTPFD
jgi:hypothetical protein